MEEEWSLCTGRGQEKQSTRERTERTEWIDFGDKWTLGQKSGKGKDWPTHGPLTDHPVRTWEMSVKYKAKDDSPARLAHEWTKGPSKDYSCDVITLAESLTWLSSCRLSHLYMETSHLSNWQQQLTEAIILLLSEIQKRIKRWSSNSSEEFLCPRKHWWR